MFFCISAKHNCMGLHSTVHVNNTWEFEWYYRYYQQKKAFLMIKYLSSSPTSMEQRLAKEPIFRFCFIIPVIWRRLPRYTLLSWFRSAFVSHFIYKTGNRNGKVLRSTASQRISGSGRGRAEKCGGSVCVGQGSCSSANNFPPTKSTDKNTFHQHRAPSSEQSSSSS